MRGACQYFTKEKNNKKLDVNTNCISKTDGEVVHIILYGKVPMEPEDQKFKTSN